MQPARNIDLFNESVALIFGELFSQFPVPIYLNYESLTKKLFKGDESKSADNALDVFINTVSWLKTSGYIWVDSESERDVYGVVLSQKGLEVLKLIPDSEVALTIGEQLAEMGCERTTEERASLVTIAITEGSKL